MKIKLRDITIDDLRRFKKDVCCDLKECKSCPLKNANCNTHSEYCWVYNKEMFSETFLDQEIEIEIEDEILTEKEREYLANIIKPFRNEVEYIEKYNYSNNPQYLRIKMIDNTSIFIPLSKIKKYYKNIEVKREYTLEELGL